MLVYVLIGLCLVLLGITGLQFTYLAYVDRLDRERRKYIKGLESKYAALSTRLASAEKRLAEQDALLTPDEAWADVIEDR